MVAYGLSVDDIEQQQAARIAEQYPGWEAWRGLNHQWHARLQGAEKPVMVHADTAEELAEQIRLSAR